MNRKVFMRGYMAAAIVLWSLVFFFGYLQYNASMQDTVTLDRRAIRQSSPDDVINVCMSVDGDRLIGLVAAINSIYTNTAHSVMFYIVVPRSAREHLELWLGKLELPKSNYVVRFFNADRIRSKIKVYEGRPDLSNPMNYARFYYPEIFPELRGVAIHVDDDCIVRGDISELIGMSLTDDRPIALSNDCQYVSKRIKGIDRTYAEYINFSSERIKPLHLDPNACSFNTGVYVFDVDWWRATNTTKSLEYWIELNRREHIYGNRNGGGGSQPPMMLVFYQRYALISWRWNLRHLGTKAALAFSPKTIAEAKLLHWSGSRKPWHGFSKWNKIWDRYFVPDPLGIQRPVRKTLVAGAGGNSPFVADDAEVFKFTTISPPSHAVPDPYIARDSMRD